MKISLSLLLAFFFCLLQGAVAQQRWGVGPKYIQYDKKDVFLSGVNYVPSHEWMLNLEVWDEQQVEKDLIGMQSVGVQCVRFFPFWHLTQPTPDKLDEHIMQRIDRVLALGRKHGLTFQLSLITGWMSGGVFLPDWALGNVFKDPTIVQGQRLLAREFARRYKNNPTVQSFDFGNELNVLIGQMALLLTPQEVDAWMQTIYAAFKEGDPNCLVTNGIGTGFDPYFNIEAIARSCDVLSLHTYPNFHGTAKFDPLIGQRNLYSGNFITEWTAMMHKPVLVQENGSSNPDPLIASWLRIFCVSSWAEGATGYFWWGSHFVASDYKVQTPALRKELSMGKMQDGELSADKVMGLLTTANEPNERGTAYAECAGWLKTLGVGWVDQLPVCYILVPHTTEFNNLMRRYITPFTLAKQAHFDVKINWEDQPIPADAACVVIPGFALSAPGKQNMAAYLRRGGQVYQSYYNDLAPAIVPTGRPDTVVRALAVLPAPAAGPPIRTRSVRVRKVRLGAGVSPLAAPAPGAAPGDQLPNVFMKAPVGKGTCYYLAANVEEALWDSYNPWATDDSYRFYAALMPAVGLRIDNKYVEFYHKKRGTEELLVLLNHENSEQPVVVSSDQEIQLADAIKNSDLGRQRTFSLRLKPAEILFLRLAR